MPKLIPYAFELAVETNRDILLLVFGPWPTWESVWTDQEAGNFAAQRREISAWLDSAEILWRECWLPGVEKGFVLPPPGLTAIYIDLAHEPDDPGYRRFIARIEHPDGMPLDKNVVCYVYTLQSALEDEKIWASRACASQDSSA